MSRNDSAASTSQSAAGSGPDVTDRANIILIMADDMGFSDIGCMGAEIRTPHLDRMAAGGMRLTQLYNNARCCPTRASLLTGLYPHQTGIGHMMADLGHPSYRGFLNEDCITLGEGLGAAGYSTHLIGKWHVGGQYSPDRRDKWRPGSPGFPRPIDRGFDEHFGTLGGSGSYYLPHGLIRNDVLIDDPGPNFYYTDAITDESVRVIEDAASAGGKPFFAFVSHVAPHWPLHAPEAEIEPYRDTYRVGWDAIRLRRFERMKELGVIAKDWDMSPRDPYAPPWEAVKHRDWEAARMAVYAAQVSRMDAGIGRILETLERTGQAENTLVMFLSDNGGCAELLREEGLTEQILPLTQDGRPVRSGNDPSIMPGPPDTYMSYDLPWANVSNTPFRLYKHWVHEGGISGPCVAYWPGVIPAETISQQPCHVVDLMPTFLQIAAGTYPAEFGGSAIHACEGESLTSLLVGEPWSRRSAICWEHEGNRALRLGKWKLVSRYPDEWELYDMNCDRTELNDLAGDLPDVVEELSIAYQRWAERTGVVPWETVVEWLTSRGLPLWEEVQKGPR